MYALKTDTKPMRRIHCYL